MNEYEQKQQAKRERLERAAERARDEASSRFDRAHNAVAGIPFGQPILVGHHSEKRHRAAIERSNANMRKGSEALKAADDYAYRAAAVGTGGISSDDPDAVAKLRAELDEMTKRRDYMKAANAYWRKHGTMKGYAELSDDAAARLDAEIPTRYTWERQPFAKYQLSNLGANIRRVEGRIATLSKVAEQRAAVTSGAVDAPAVETIGGATIEQDIAENRVVLRFPARLALDDYKRVRRAGFIWARTRNAFVRKLSAAALYNARAVAQQIAGSAPTSTN